MGTWDVVVKQKVHIYICTEITMGTWDVVVKQKYVSMSMSNRGDPIFFPKIKIERVP